MQSHKICRVMDLALRNGVPIIGLIDSGGARIQEGVKSLGGYAEIFRRNALYSGVIPQISLMLGPCAGGAAYSPALTDLILMVRRASFMFLTGPEVIKGMTGEIIDAETPGWRGHPPVDQRDGTPGNWIPSRRCWQQPGAYLGYFPSNNVENPPFQPGKDDPLRMDVELNTIIPLDSNEPYSMHEVIRARRRPRFFYRAAVRLGDECDNRIGRLGGHAVGIVAQEPTVMAGVIDIDAADKMARFVRMCDCFNIPLVTFVDSPGFPARQRAGTRRNHPPRCESIVRLFGSHRAESDSHHQESIRRRLRCDEQQIPGNGCDLCLAERRNRRHGG